MNTNIRATFKCPHMFPTLQSLIGCQTANDAWSKVYPYTLHELGLQSVINTPQGDVSAPIKKYKALIRDDGQEIAVVKKSYTVVQPATLCEQFTPFIESGLIDLIAGGGLKDGTRISIIGKIKGSEREIVEGEEIGAFVNFFAGLDGSLGIGASVFGVQARCLNGLCALISKFSTSLRHTKTVHIKLSEARETIAKTILDFNKSIDAYTHLATRQVTRAKQETYVRNVLAPIDTSNPDKEISTRTENVVRHVIELLDTQQGLELVPAVRGTPWQAYSAMTEYLTHEVGRNDDSRLNSRLFGESAILNRQALNLAMAM